MLAYRYKAGVPRPVAERVPIPTLKPDQVLLKILAAGVCHSDLSCLDPTTVIGKGAIPRKTFTFGHESAGLITELGSAVSAAFPHLKVGTYVVVGPSSCRRDSCLRCTAGLPNLCPHLTPHGLGADGSWAEYLCVRAAAAVPVPGTPETFPPAVAAVATDAVLTAYHAVKSCCALRPEHTVVCIGLGGVGLNGVAIAKACLGVRCLVASDMRAEAMQSARAAGADYTVPAKELRRFVKEKKLAVDFVIDFVGAQDTFDLSLSIVRPGGTIHTLGIGANTLSIAPINTMMKDLTWKTSFWGTNTDLDEVLRAIADGKLKPKVETRPMSQCVQVLEDMHHGRLTGRVALIPDTLSERSRL
ncbi:zinc-binding dehydrogenase [Phanerochaete sordida]|uniref:Zinc-binding dehydrogenase n=1 Tax=Phanerochaete sordida TaxID=48140 RepID=A0A9P3G521_9APHY|nr:zinc-binding dehydrogenase [Phanerochaete sordida]